MTLERMTKPLVTPADIAREIVAKTREEIARRVDPIEAKLAAPTAPVEAVVDVRRLPAPPAWAVVVERDELGTMVGARLQPLGAAEARPDAFAELAGVVGELAQAVASLRAEVASLRATRAAPPTPRKSAQSSLPLFINGSGADAH